MKICEFLPNPPGPIKNKYYLQMKKDNEKLDTLFEKFNQQWDIEELSTGHKQRFQSKLIVKKRSISKLLPLAIAASIVLLLGISLIYNEDDKSSELQFASKETKQTDSIFTVIINKELEKLNGKKSPENKRIIVDALKQMKVLDQDYEKIIKELETNGENKQIIFAMLSNLQTRISFLQTVLQHIEKNEQSMHLPDEKTI
ncbi:hypothetical protein SAMN05444372_10513 [Flavobacterium micromati]|uniref:Anti-sigma factor n=2 Tax=Flavobacterium micromati TaxID=229205 RepID=A0A1M5J434_9FLAO|nr:hypothetical protein SAMN05444372_10513 [Flavobacterium micromati]